MILRASSATNTTPLFTSPVSTARTPVCALIALMAFIAKARLAPMSAVVVIEAVATPLIVITPAPPAPVIAVPPTVVLPKTATTPVCALAALIAAALAIALEDLSLEDKVSSAADEARTVTPFNTKSPAAVFLANEPAVPLKPVEVREAREPRPMSLVCTESTDIVINSPARTPVCNLMAPAEPSNNLMLLKLVCLATSSI